MDALYELADVIVRFLDSRPGLLISLVYLTLAAIPVTLLHEFGHAVAARRLLGSDVEVSVGSAGKLADMRLGQIALAGPAASLLGTALTAWALSIASPTGVVHDLLWAATLAGVFGVLNLVPLSIQEQRNGPPVRTDGRLALDALRVARALR